MKSTINYRILIADSSDLLRERLISLVNSLNSTFNIEQAKNGDEALEKIHSFRPNALVLDIQMGEKNGIQVLQEIPKKRRPTVFVLTNDTYPQYKKKCISLGADYFFDKSTELDFLLNELHKLSKEPLLHG